MIESVTGLNENDLKVRNWHLLFGWRPVNISMFIFQSQSDEKKKGVLICTSRFRNCSVKLEVYIRSNPNLYLIYTSWGVNKVEVGGLPYLHLKIYNNVELGIYLIGTSRFIIGIIGTKIHVIQYIVFNRLLFQRHVLYLQSLDEAKIKKLLQYKTWGVNKVKPHLGPYLHIMRCK